MPTYDGTANFPTTNGTATAYRLDIQARTSAVTGGTLVEIWAQVTMTRNPGIPAFGPAGTRAWSLAGARRDSTTGPADASGNSTFSYNFSNANPQNVYNFFNRFVPFGAGDRNNGNTSRLSVTVGSATNSSFFTSATAVVDVPLFTLTTISYNSNGGTAAPASQTLTPGGSFTVGAAPTRTGYTFVNWSGSNGVTYTPGSSATVPSSNVTLTAAWALAAPTGLTVGTRTPNSIQLSWTGISGASGYELSLGDTVITTTTATNYTFVTLTAATSYTLGVAAFIGSGSSRVLGPKGTINSSTIGNPTYAADAVYPTAKIGLPYAGSVTATNATSYALAYGNLPPGLTLNTTNGTIGGTPPGGEPERPIQRETFHFNENERILDSFTFGIRASGAAGSTPETKQFTIKTVFPGERLSTTPTDLIVARRREGSAWVPIQRVRRFNGSTWVDIATT
jgi:uncharacterized repeat protein (TIGR02543 family)